MGPAAIASKRSALEGADLKAWLPTLYGSGKGRHPVNAQAQRGFRSAQRSAERCSMIFELRFLRYGKRDGHPETIARRTELAPDLEALKARVKQLPGTLGWPEGAEAVRIMDNVGHEIETWRRGEDDV
jgi:hypothetical protein